MTVYYNEFKPSAVRWLRRLSGSALIPKGFVDHRDIRKVSIENIQAFTECHFFAGIGGWPLALHRAGWPRERRVWTGSPPCQPYSSAGKQRANKDPRDLWPRFFELIREFHPDTIIGEQVENSIKHGWLDRISADLEREGYAVGSAVLGAHSVGAPHRRQRLYWLADSRSERWDRRTSVEGSRRVSAKWSEESSDPGHCCRDGGVGHSIRPGPQGCWPGTGSQPRSGGVCVQATQACAWDDFDIVRCRDGKYRRVESSSQCVVDGLSDGMAPCWSEALYSIQEKVSHYASETSSGPDQVLQTLRKSVQPKYIQWCSGGHDRFREEAVLFSALCELSRKLGNFHNSETSGIRTIPQGSMRNVRKDRPASCSPQGHELPQQRPIEPSNFVRELSQEIAPIAEEIAKHIIHSWPTTTRDIGRTTLLKGYGNAIVVPLAAEFVRSFLAAERDLLN